MLNLIPFPYKVLIVVALIGGLTAGYFGWRTHERNIGATQQKFIDDQAITKQKKEAEEVLRQAIAKVESEEIELRNFKDKQEVEDAKNQKIIENQSIRLRNLALVNGRLRDPNASRCGEGSNPSTSQNPASAGNSATNGAETSGLLSRNLSELLQRLTREADEINDAYISCRADSMLLRLTLTPDLTYR